MTNAALENAHVEAGVRAPRVALLGVVIDNLTMDEAIAAILGRMRGHTPTQVCFINADCVNIAHRDAEYRAIVRRADLVFADGIGLRLSGRALGRPVLDNVNGTDMFPRLCEALAGGEHGVFLLGASPGVAERVVRWIADHHPGVRVVGAEDGYFQREEEAAVVSRIAASGADLLLVAFGEPRQTRWIHRHLGDLGVKAAIGVGGLFDFYSGRILRAPPWMRRLGLEWLYRLLQEPRRLWRRYLVGNVVFFARLSFVAAARLCAGRDRRSP